jgi:type I protein arginine methyltransferase
VTGHLAGIDYHRRLLADEVRTLAFRDAIQACVGADDVVVDVGAGTGILSLFAARAGARKVYAIESTAVAHLARQIVRDNGLEDRIEVLHADARTVSLPEPATVLVSECLGNFLMSDGMIGTLQTCARLLAPGARILPASVDLLMAPGSVGPLMGQLSAWTDPLYGFRFDACTGSAQNDIYRAHVPPACLGTEGQSVARWNLTHPLPPGPWSAQWTFERDQLIDGVVGWFTADLGPKVPALNTGPGVTTHWGQTLFPLPPTQVDAGDTMTFTLDVKLGHDDLAAYHWSGSFSAPGEPPCVFFERGQDLRFTPWRATDRVE